MGTIIFVNNRMCVECISFCTKMCHNVRKRTGRKEIDNMNKIYDKVKECYKQVNQRKKKIEVNKWTLKPKLSAPAI